MGNNTISLTNQLRTVAVMSYNKCEVDIITFDKAIDADDIEVYLQIVIII